MPIIKIGKYNFDYQGSFGEKGSLMAIQHQGLLDPPVSLFLKRIIPIMPKCLFLDIGANIGFFSLYVSALSKAQATIIAVEVDEDNCKRIKHNITSNQLENNITLHHAAAGVNIGKANFYFSSVNDHAHSFYDHGDSYNDDNVEMREVDVITIDSLITSYNECESIVLKIDTEGAEYEVLQGASELLKKHDNLWIVCELHTYGLRKMGHNVEELRQFMNGLGYDAFAFQYNIETKQDFLPIWIPPKVKIKQNYVTDILFAKKDNLHHLWQEHQII